jgi:hypothetical protein
MTGGDPQMTGGDPQITQMFTDVRYCFSSSAKSATSADAPLKKGFVGPFLQRPRISCPNWGELNGES